LLVKKLQLLKEIAKRFIKIPTQEIAKARHEEKDCIENSVAIFSRKFKIEHCLDLQLHLLKLELVIPSTCFATLLNQIDLQLFLHQ